MASLSYQTRNYTCGLHAYLNALSVFEIEMSHAEAKKLIGTNSKEGTSQRGLLRGIESAELKATVYRQRNPQTAVRWLWKWSAITPIIVLLDGYLTVGSSHWATVTGRIGDKIILVDPTANVASGENGVHVLSRGELLERWKYRICYAIRITLKESR